MEPTELSNAIKILCDMSNRLQVFMDDHAAFLEAIKRMDRGFLQIEWKKLSEHSISSKGILKPVNFVKFVVVDLILNNRNINIELLEEIKKHILEKNTDYFKEYPDFKEALDSMESKNYFQSWDNFKILFYVYFDHIKEKINPLISDIAEHLKLTLNMKDSKATLNSFGWNQNFGGSDCWIALYPPYAKSHQEAYQIFLRIYPSNKLVYGVASGSKIEKEFRMLEEQDADSLNISKMQNFLFEKAKPKYEELNSISPQKKTKPDAEYEARTAKNIILYGPPGTGKTYLTYEMAVKIIEPDFAFENREQLIRKYKELQERGNIVFVTFHQSYSYEEFIEGLRYDETLKVPVVQSGVFQTIVESARADYSSPIKKVSLDFDNITFYKMSLGRTLEGDEDIYEHCMKENVIALGWGGQIDYSASDDRDSIVMLYKEKYGTESDYDFNITAIDCFRNYMKKGDIVFISKGNRFLRAIGRITGDYFYNEKSSIRYRHFRKVEWLLINQEIPVEKIMKKNFSQQAIYQLNKNYLIKNNIEELLTRKQDKKIQKYVLIIDEINRGNISKIFGELITLIEEDKRIGMENEIMVRLPYSGKSDFGVPPNIYIIGTMNTADRSIALMDAAIRRRFKFEEVLPDAKIITDVLIEKGLNQDFVEIIEKTFSILNKRIEVLLDRDHTIGHSYFLGIGQEDYENELYLIWYNKIIPLIKEYFYNDWDKLKLILGEYNEKKRRGFVRVLESEYKGIFEDQYEDEYPCEIVIYDRKDVPSFSEILNNTFVRFRDEPAE